MNFEILNYAAALTTILGGLLSLYIFIRNTRKNKPLICIIPQAYMGAYKKNISSKYGALLSKNDFDPKAEYFAFEIINKSLFPVIVVELGFKTRGKDKITIPYPIEETKKGFPIQIQPRDSKVLYVKCDSLINSFKKYRISGSYVKTACNETFFGNSMALKKIIKYSKLS